ncbi:hypothetical protein OUZ56_012837 [Daphnia magna]|uniref:Uncharacterized protein n=1 Tax=Daphnia magna TaxID=35525 RepID=A0ABQ9Z467_9CRUS|nr:hypothetical protein OUZ56_012837 [Daphnia magna]
MHPLHVSGGVFESCKSNPSTTFFSAILRMARQFKWENSVTSEHYFHASVGSGSNGDQILGYNISGIPLSFFSFVTQMRSTIDPDMVRLITVKTFFIRVLSVISVTATLVVISFAPVTASASSSATLVALSKRLR